MKSDSENFETLRKLMALKRHEVPPPGYFNRLPRSIISRIERGEGKLTFLERISAEFTIRPGFAYAFAIAACGALTTSLYSVKTQSVATGEQPAVASGWRTGSTGQAFANEYNPAEPLHVANWLGNTNPGAIMPELPSLFSRGTYALPVAYQTHN
ncbi:MAG TPA: hypothetical protein VGO67_19730 [Verrucomicrobiae bacterium]|jgi:hypothetical protein